MIVANSKYIVLRGAIEKMTYEILMNKKSKLISQISWSEKDKKTEDGSKTVSNNGLCVYQKFNNISSLEIPKKAKE